MKVITSYHGPDNLYTKVFVASEEGFNVTSTIICGKKEPALCPLFGRVCTPEDPVGPCMVSSEGACAAAYKYGDF